MRICSKCGNRRQRRKFQNGRTCIDCIAEARDNRRNNREHGQYKRKMEAGFLKCLNCKQWRPLGNFSISGTYKEWQPHDTTVGIITIDNYYYGTIQEIESGWVFYKPCLRCELGILKNTIYKGIGCLNREKERKDKIKILVKMVDKEDLTDKYLKKRLSCKGITSKEIDTYPILLKLERIKTKTKRVLRTKSGNKNKTLKPKI